MNFSGALLFFFSALGAFNGLALSLYILIKARQKHKANVFLALALMMLSIRAGKSVFFYFDHNLSQIYVQIGIIACLFIGPFLYFYVATVCNKEHKSPKWQYHLALWVPLILLLTFSLPYYEYRTLWANSILHAIYIVWFLYLLGAATMLYLRIISEDGKGKLTPSMQWTLHVFAVFFLVWLAYFTTRYTSYIAGAMTFTVIGYLLILFILNTRKKQLFLLSDPTLAQQKISSEKAQTLMEAMEALFMTKAIYKESSLKCSDVAVQLNIPNYQLSQAINSATGSNFNNYVNTYRVEAAKKLLREKPGFTIEAIGKECGFQSKSSFYAAFKKQTGTTPSKFV